MDTGRNGVAEHLARGVHLKQADTTLRTDLSAVVCPLTPSELPLALKNLSLWGQKIAPARAGAERNGKTKPRLIFSFNCAEKEELAAPLRAAFASHPVLVTAFRELDVIFCDLPPEKDIYLREMPNPPPEFGTKAGPNWLWYTTLKALRAERGFVFLMETDCTPIAPNWLRKLDAVCRQNSDAWIVGSQYCGVSPLHWSIARHINGNALYHVGDPAFWAFIEEFFWPWLHKQIRERQPQLAYDCAWEIFLNRQEMERAGNIDWLTARNLMQRFRLSNYIVNIAGHAEQQGYYHWTRADIVDRYPNALFVHGPLAKPDSFVRNGVALGRASAAKTIVAAGRTVSYSGTADAEQVRFRRSFWLPSRLMDQRCTIRLRFTLESSPKSRVCIDLNDSNGIALASQRFETFKPVARKCKLEYKMAEQHAFITLVLRFESRDDAEADHTVQISNTVLEIIDGDKPPLRIKRLFE